MPALGEVLVVVSNALDGSRSWLELLDGRGLILWYPFSGQLHALAIPHP